MEGEAHRDQHLRPAWREGPDPVDYVDPPEVLNARTIDQLLGPKADYRRARGAYAGWQMPVFDDATWEAAARPKAPRLRWWQRLFRRLQGATDVEA